MQGECIYRMWAAAEIRGVVCRSNPFGYSFA